MSAVTVGLGWLTEIDCLCPVTETRHTMDAIFGRLEFYLKPPFCDLPFIILESNLQTSMWKKQSIVLSISGTYEQ